MDRKEQRKLLFPAHSQQRGGLYVEIHAESENRDLSCFHSASFAPVCVFGHDSIFKNLLLLFHRLERHDAELQFCEI